jgi:hypothetical protein
MNCLGCAYEYENKCYWFKEKKAIPDKILNKGCDFFVNKMVHSLLNYAIVIFNGRII